MAEETRTPIRLPAPEGGELSLTVVVETTQTEPDDDGVPSPLVVALQIRNTTSRRGRGYWWTTGPAPGPHTVLPGENAEERVPPPQRVGLWRYEISAALGSV